MNSALAYFYRNFLAAPKLQALPDRVREQIRQRDHANETLLRCIQLRDHITVEKVLNRLHKLLLISPQGCDFVTQPVGLRYVDRWYGPAAITRVFRLPNNASFSLPTSSKFICRSAG